MTTPTVEVVLAEARRMIAIMKAANALTDGAVARELYDLLWTVTEDCEGRPVKAPKDGAQLLASPMGLAESSSTRPQ